MIVTVTLNAALDITYRVPRLRPAAEHRVAETAERPGGKGLNVARVLGALGHRAVVAGFAGGPVGAVLHELLGDSPGGGLVEDALTPIAGNSRRTLGVVDTGSGNTTQLNEAGPYVTPDEWDAFLGTYTGLLADASAVALCGSLPPGLAVGSYASLVRAAQAADVPVLLDTGGEPLRRGIAARPDLVKPNAEELAGLTGFTEPVRAAREARRRGARAVAASLGPDGMLVSTADGGWQAAPPERLRGNPTGAGDSAVAGLLSALVEGLPWPDRLARAVALSAATVLAPAAGEFDQEAYEALLPRVAVTERVVG
ncbi:1-phosphofructokinase family hexose kinase [Streptomyces lycii]|uniref:1-phosphofructokinase family hexose kinase n=1 Tax=Streptomyces lycii TaxID=2654337 RepID=A0ABQ7FJU9_9ACTN|nr:1-phosphofructokinase family hexose kinase [Streptomyces lycii]KAF4409254.1 1-phosphofructokinase family hexose kinase [Streptomyces lycii]